ncbi:Glucose-1-phosphate adenylyltransferase small subunit, chloroplastic [Capsicum baccatum]|uniref:glucose-1-phosphate adenylyltransferase n=1 Tax=Capsicum baccatum TaxID=33114 RepID=A0A2G2X2Q0_CAPBA|nr:Glucose-1-phosphate adenylyltransferase small subunit, chloroplastic [Capsicum baccatum]
MAVSMGTLKPSPHSFIIERIDNADRAISFQSLSFASSHLSGDKLISPASLRSRRCSSGVNSYRSRTPVIVSPKAVSDSTNAQTCLDPDASRSVLGIILGGGAGTRLYPLTKKRAKPAVPLGANYRLIDISVSNCINSTISKIYVLTQFNSASLNRHLSRAYTSNMGGYKNEGFVEVLAAQQSPENPNWFQERVRTLARFGGSFCPCIRGFAHMRKVIAVDDTHLYGKYEGVLLIAVAQDTENHIYPIVFYVVDKENDTSWTFFFEKLKSIMVDEPNLCFISDRHKSIANGIAKVITLNLQLS